MSNANHIHKEKMSIIDKFALGISSAVGTMYFFTFCVLLTMAPLIFPSILTYVQFISSAFLQLVLLPVLAIGQNLSNRHSEIRAELDYEADVRSEKDLKELKEKVEYLTKLLKKQARNT